MLYKLALVDDEDWILDGLQNAIEWDKIGFQVVGAFTNGRDALEALLENPPDAILTDIKMPMQDGISLVKELREAGLKDLEVVFLSGYDDFGLAQSSLRLGAVDYVLKPSAPEQIIEVFTRIKNRLDERREREKEKQAATGLVQAGVQVFKDAVYNHIMSGNETGYERLMTLYSEFVEREKGKPFMVVSVALESTISEHMPRSEDVRTIEYLRQMVVEFREHHNKGIYLIKNLFSYSFVFSGYDEEVADNLTESMKRKLRRDTGEHLISAKSNVYRDFQMVKKAYDSSLDRLFRLDMPDSVQMLYFKLGNDAVLKAAIEDRDQQIVLWSLKNWMVKVDDTEPEHRWRMMKRLLYNLSLIFLQNSISSQEICNLYQSIREGDCESVKEAVISFVKSELLASNNANSRNAHLCKAAAKYISRNYTEEITLNELAEQFYISPNYLGTLFKKNMGMGIKEYQTAIRLEQAEALIASGKFKLYQVAQMVGYSNYEYFRKIYFKHKSRNPSE